MYRHLLETPSGLTAQEMRDWAKSKAVRMSFSTLGKARKDLESLEAVRPRVGWREEKPVIEWSPRRMTMKRIPLPPEDNPVGFEQWVDRWELAMRGEGHLFEGVPRAEVKERLRNAREVWSRPFAIPEFPEGPDWLTPEEHRDLVAWEIDCRMERMDWILGFVLTDHEIRSEEEEEERLVDLNTLLLGHFRAFRRFLGSLDDVGWKGYSMWMRDSHLEKTPFWKANLAYRVQKVYRAREATQSTPETAP